MSPKLTVYKIFASEKMNAENGSMRDMSIGNKKEMWEWSTVL